MPEGVDWYKGSRRTQTDRWPISVKTTEECRPCGERRPVQQRGKCRPQSGYKRVQKKENADRYNREENADLRVDTNGCKRKKTQTGTTERKMQTSEWIQTGAKERRKRRPRKSVQTG